MFGVSALYHRVTWSPRRRLLIRRLDHATIYVLIAGTYTPFGLLVLTGAWRIGVLSVVWSGAAIAVFLKFAWPDAPKWVAALIGVALGWVGVVAFPELLDKAGTAATLLALAGGVCYTLGAVVYARERPDPRPRVFGYHEVFHALVIAAVAFQYAAVAIIVS
jgi:hemolysin III